MFTYNCDDLNWIGEEDNYAAVGVNVLSTTTVFRSFANYALSRTSEVGMVACNHTRFNRPWTNLIYRIGRAIDEDQIARSVCFARVTNDEITFPISTETLNTDTSLLLPRGLRFSDCPCSIQQAVRDPRFIFVDEIGFLGDFTCFFSRFTVLYNGVYLLNRCCYDSRRYVKTCSYIIFSDCSISCSSALIVRDLDGHGSVLTLFNELPRASEYISNTIDFQTDCCGDVGLCDEFYKRRVPNFCNHYIPPRFRKHTLHGIGEILYLSVHHME